MALPRIAVVIGSTRPTRFGDRPARWIFDIASKRGDIEVELIDLRDFPLPFFEEVASNAWAPTQSEVGVRWQKTLATFDGFIFSAAEYNRGPTGVLKNALDYAYPEWNRKTAAFVGYGGVGGARAVEQLRLIAIELQMAPIRHGVHIGGADFTAARQGTDLAELPHLQKSAETMLDELVWWTRALKTARG
ncbi:NADPH-dependent FMN reductase [Labrys wisconsinensis]|uniref:NAD(P)H-dependent FMN reductase n=1 Tax=Labrys wisconsinensis TaxID=425677 RepID=A0ABU0JKR0_9HYPH|nr:NADPH-dependent FMN reductase [Labrys wisconsinensis]MDQ0474882.1 NAD(P)H-dependent FMN reductase [Labrys wisconsinensis]